MAMLGCNPTRARTRPIDGRYLALALASLVALAFPRLVRSAEPPAAAPLLTESQAVKRALDNPALADLRVGWVGEATAEGIERATWEDPSLAYTREQLVGAALQGEDYLTLSQTLDVSGRRGLARRAAAEREEAARHRADAVSVHIVALTRHRFYRLLLAQEKKRSLEAWRAHVAGHLELVIAREKAGDAAPYDRLRLERELASIDALVEREDAAAIKAWALLSALLHPERAPTERALPVPTVDGRLLPRARASVARSIEATTATPEVEARKAEARALAFDRRVGSRWWVPSPTLGAGWKGVDLPAGGRANGFVVSLGIPIPVLDRGRGERTRVASRERALRGEASLAATEARAQASALAREVAQLSEAAQRMDRKNAEVTSALVRAAESGYRGGEIGVMELVDAYRSSTEAELLELDLSMQARDAEIELRRRTEDRS
jgi:cobalt-zinc-cadmium efflux system outer membrane protein